jgi:hypothetical protein
MVKPSGIHPDGLGLRSNPKISNLLFSSDNRVALYFYLSVRSGQGGDRDKSTAREIVTEYLSADLREAIAVANVRNEYRHLNHITEFAARFLESAVEVLEKLPDLTFEVTSQRLARVIHRCGLPSEPYRSASFGDHSLRIASLL